ncbi:MAG: 4Fe-4S dicluster domain-containing protein [Candidatus Lokiarchaeota archaeon]|nr:4Fe-4S dicluster domain-containing protein [Candidatus Lokiarchaeota archaeon]
MTIINITLPFGLVKEIDDYSTIINEILKHKITLNILKFSVGSGGVTLLLDIPEDKISTITESLKKNNIIVNKKGRIVIDEEKCIDCGACISLCPTDALHFNRDDRLEFFDEKCIGCLICLDSCPRHAIEENK